MAPIELSYDMIMQAVTSEVKKKVGAIDEEMIIATLKSKKVEK